MAFSQLNGTAVYSLLQSFYSRIIILAVQYWSGMEKTSDDDASCSRLHGNSSPAFLLAQVGAHAASRFAERLAQLKLTPPHAGILRILSSTPAIPQQMLAATLGVIPSRLVALIDDMEARQLVERREDPDDRRRYALHLTEEGRSMLARIGRASGEHSQALFAALSRNEQRQLAVLLQRIADQQKLTRGVHPGYRQIGRDAPVQVVRRAFEHR
jgi:DNA-binding MarR family transcriptional regulator